MDEQFINKYKPKNIDDINLDIYSKKIIELYLKNNKINFIIQGNTCTGKTTLINIILQKYYNNKDININIDDNILYINLLRDYGINYYRNDIKNFCNINNFGNKKKTIIIDDLDSLNENCQQIILTLLNKYNNINFLFTFFDLNKINPIFLTLLEYIKIKQTSNNFLENILNNIIKNEKLDLEKNLVTKIVKLSNFCIPLCINNLNKLVLYGKIDEEIIESIICNISIQDFDQFIELCKNKDYKNSFKNIIKYIDDGFSVIDILDEFFIYIKNYSVLDDMYKFKIIKIISNYINIFNNVHEDKIELLFFTNCIIKTFNKLEK